MKVKASFLLLFEGKPFGKFRVEKITAIKFRKMGHVKMAAYTAMFGVSVFPQIGLMAKSSDCRNFLVLFSVSIQIFMARQTVFIRDEPPGIYLHLSTIKIIRISQKMDNHIFRSQKCFYKKVFWPFFNWNMALAASDRVIVLVQVVTRFF